MHSEDHSQSQENVRNADRIIDSLCQSMRITPDGKRWLKLALDPFPDETRTCGGYPDIISSKSNIVPYKLTTTVTGAAFATPWDCNILFGGFTDSTPLRSTTKVNNRFSAVGQGATAYDIGGVQIRSALTGTSLTLPTVSSNLFANLPTDRPWRVLSGGIEVYNETEPLYRSGKVVCWRQPTTQDDKFTAGILDAAATSVSPVTACTTTTAPENLSNAQNLPDSTNWSAEEGAYIVFAMAGTTNTPNVYPEGVTIAPAPWYHDIAVPVDYFPVINGASPNQTLGGAYNNCSVPFNSCGMYFADLSIQTKLDIVWHLVVEIFPPPTDRLLSALATPSAELDYNAFTLYSRALRNLPVGVPVRDNGLGTFFLEAAKSIASWAAPKLLKGLDSKEEEENRELSKIKTELEVLKALQAQETRFRQTPQPRVVQTKPSGQSHIVVPPVRTKNNNVGGMVPTTTINTGQKSPLKAPINVNAKITASPQKNPPSQGVVKR